MEGKGNLNKNWQTAIYSLGVLVTGTLLLSVPTLLNNHPYLYYDSSFYLLRAAQNLESWSLIWRPLAYSLFLKAIGSPSSLVFTTVMQNAVVVTCLYFVSRSIFPQLTKVAFLIGLFLMYLTPLPHYSNFILPDVFAGFLILFFGLLLVNSSWQERVAGFLGFIFCSLVHYSNLLIGSIFGFLGPFIQKWTLRTKLFIASMILFPWLLLPWINYFLVNNFTISNVTHLLLFSRVMATGIGKRYLDEYCDKRSYLLCQEREYEFHIWKWGTDTQIGRLGGIQKVQESLPELNYDILTSSYLFPFLGESLLNILKQLIQVADPLLPIQKDNLIFSELIIYSHEGGENYLKQRIAPSFFTIAKPYLAWLFAVSFALSVASLICLSVQGKISHSTKIIFFLALFAYGLNAIVCGFFTDPAARYNDRLTWVFPWLLWLEWQNLRSRKSTG